MNLTELTLRDFRNYGQLTVKFSAGINVLIGENAQGKTNLLEAIYVLAMTRSHRTANDHDLIRWTADATYLSGRIDKTSGTIPLDLAITKKGKTAKVNHLEQARLSQYLGQFNVILFAPEDLALVKGAPSVRRRFIDMEFGQMSSKYLYNLGQYRLILKQRNQYLRQLQTKQQTDKLLLDVFSDQLAAYGAEIISQRTVFLVKLEKWATALHKQISHGREELTFKYMTQVSKDALAATETIYAELNTMYQKNQAKEIFQGTTLYGPHRDDLHFIVNGNNVQTFGSQGQQRTTALAVKLAEIDLMKQETGEYPVLLLDDVLSELDDDRQTYLLKTIQHKVQTFITTTSLSGITQKLIDEPRIFDINDGQLELEEEQRD